AARQARAATALVRLGHGEEVWPLLRHGEAPRLRSFLLNWLTPLGADPQVLARELERLDSRPPPVPEMGRSDMGAVWFHRETSIRRALILALGQPGRVDLSMSDRERLIHKLLELYENDPDAGIHGAAEWTLRRWNQDARVDEIVARLKGRNRGSRRSLDPRNLPP